MASTPPSTLRQEHAPLNGSQPAPPPSSPYRHLVFVYGTLKRGENNYAAWLADPCHALFMGTARTHQRYPFFVNLAPSFMGCSPVVLNEPVTEEAWAAAQPPSGGETPSTTAAWQARAQHVEGELFLVTEAMRCWLDVLEDVEDGVYTRHTVAVEHVRPPPSLLRELETAGSRRTLYEHLVAPFQPGLQSWKGVEATIYFRASRYPDDWASPSPTSSTRLLSSFSAQAVLAEYGPRFATGVPAHRRGPDSARSLQQMLDALPTALQPPMSTTNQKRRLAEALKGQRTASHSRGAEAGVQKAFSNYYDSAVDGALLDEGADPLPSAQNDALFDYGAPLLPKPLVLFIIDGIGDNTYGELGNRTPLEVVAGVSPRRPLQSGATATLSIPDAHRILQLERFAPSSPVTNEQDGVDDVAALATDDPSRNRYMNDHINTVTRAGVSGLMDPYLSGRSCGSDTAHLSFFGYDPEVYYRGRGAYETLGTAVDSSESDGDDDDLGTETSANSATMGRKDTASLVDEKANDAIRTEKGLGDASGGRFVLDDEDVCFKSNFATFADPDEGGFGDEDAELERRCAPLSGMHSEADKAEAGGLAFNTNVAYFMTHRRCDREFTKEGPVLCRYLNGMIIDKDVHGEPFEYPHVLKIKYATEHRCGVALSGARRMAFAKGEADRGDSGDVSSAKRARTEGQVEEREVGMLSDKITGTDCLRDGLLLKKCVPTISQASDPVEYARAVYTCRLVEAASAKITHFLKIHAINVARRQHNKEAGESGEKRKNVANIILFRGAAKKGWVPTFVNRHGLKGFMVAPTCIIKGLGVCCGLDGKTVCSVCFPKSIGKLRTALQRRLQVLSLPSTSAEVTTSTKVKEEEARKLSWYLEQLQRVNRTNHALEGATGDYHSDLHVKVEAALHALRLRCPWPRFHTNDRVVAITSAAANLPTTSGEAHQRRFLQAHPHYDFLVLHVKGVDDAGHDGNHHQKMRMIGGSGDALNDVFTALPDGAAMCVIADHSTPLGVGDHCCEPVPVSIAVRRVTSAGADHAHHHGPSTGGGCVGLPGSTLAEDVAAFRAAWQQHGVQGKAEGPILFNGLTFANTGELVMFLLEEKAVYTPKDETQRYSEIEVGLTGACGRFRGDELIGLMKRTQYYYHYM